VPGPGVCLNETSFTGDTLSGTSYLPLSWIHFGGLGGCNLRHITKVSFEVSKSLYGLEFHYDNNYEPVRPHMCKLGRSKYSRDVKKEEFVIDGAGGEVIETVKVIFERYKQGNAYSFLNHVLLNAVEVR
jgi:hypothetical protein